MRAHLLEHLYGSGGLLCIIVGNAYVERLAALDDVMQRTHGLLDGGLRVGAVVVEDVHIFKAHAL